MAEWYGTPRRSVRSRYRRALCEEVLDQAHGHVRLFDPWEMASTVDAGEVRVGKVISEFDRTEVRSRVMASVNQEGGHLAPVAPLEELLGWIELGPAQRSIV